MHRALLNTSLALVFCALSACSQLSSNFGSSRAPEPDPALIAGGESSADSTKTTEEPTVSVDPGGQLGLNDLIRVALENSPDLARAEGELKVAQAERSAVFAIEDPQWRTDFSWDDVRVDELGGDQIRRGESFNNRIRLYPPNPWVMRAEMAKAYANIEVAEFAFILARHDIAVEVRRLYNELQFREKQARLADAVQETEETELTRLQGRLEEGVITGDDVMRQEVRALARQNNAAPARSRVQQTKAELASFIGLNDPNRIRVDLNTTMPRLEIQNDTVSLLSEIAFINSPELASLAAEESLAQGEIGVLRAAQIPWLSFIEAGDDISYRGGTPVSDTYMVRLAINIPIFSPFSKERDIHKARIDALRKESLRRRNQIERRVASAVAAIQDARQAYERYDSGTTRVIGELAAKEAEEHDVAGVRLSRAGNLLDLEEAYNEAIINLEEILRTDIATAFSAKSPPRP